jgi:outer membrane protein assembly factor BamA
MVWIRSVFLSLFFFLFLGGIKLNGQTVQTDSLEEKKSFVAAYPFAFYLPETRWGFGGAGILTYFPGKEKSINPSLWQLGGAYTLNKQILLYASYQLFLRENKTELFGEIGYYDYVYPYFGSGNNTSFDKEEKYFAKYPRIHFNYLERIKNNFRAGVLLKFDKFKISEINQGGLLESVNQLGVEGGVVTNVGFLMRYDTRDNVFQPAKGLFSTLEATTSSSFFGSKYVYREISLNLAAYFKLRTNHVLATNLFLGSQNGEVPFYKLLSIGGPKKGRGIIEGRYRGENVVLLQAEYRFPVFRRFGGVAFASTGRVGSTFKELGIFDFHHNFGAGLRFVLDKNNKLRLRLDIGFGSDKPAFYFTVGEAF